MKVFKRFAAAGLLLLGASYSAASAAQGTVYVVHGIPGVDLGLPTDLPVDVSVNGACALEGLVFGEIIGPLPFEAGSYDINISLADPTTPCAANPVISAPGVEIQDGENYSIVAHLDESGGITASVFVNELATTRRTARVNVAHVAAAPRVDVRLKRSRYWWLPARLIRDVGNGDQGDILLGRGDFDVRILPTGSRHPVFGPLPVTLERKVAYGVYAVGSLANGTFTLLLTTLEDAAPTTASAFVVHGIPGSDLGLDPGLPVDVSVNGACALAGFMFGEIIGPLELPADSYDIAIGLANDDAPCADAPVIEASGVVLDAGKSYSIVAHLSEDGGPTASVFENNLSAGPYIAGVNVFHTAAAPRVDVILERTGRYYWLRRLRNIDNGEARSTRVLRGTWDVSILPAGSRDAAFGPVTLDLDQKTVYLAYAVGSLANGSLTVLLATTPGDYIAAY